MLKDPRPSQDSRSRSGPLLPRPTTCSSVDRPESVCAFVPGASNDMYIHGSAVSAHVRLHPRHGWTDSFATLAGAQEDTRL